MWRSLQKVWPLRKMILYSCLVKDESADCEGPLLVAAGTPGNHRFGILVKDLRERSSLSPQELAERADVHVSFVRGIERGAQAPSVATARTLLACVRAVADGAWAPHSAHERPASSARSRVPAG